MPRDLMSRFWVHTVTVKTRTGQDEDGADTYSPARTVKGWLEDTTTLVRAADGAETVSSARFYCPIASSTVFTPDSQVVLPQRTAQVISVNVNDSGPLGLPDHAVISLT